MFTYLSTTTDTCPAITTCSKNHLRGSGKDLPKHFVRPLAENQTQRSRSSQNGHPIRDAWHVHTRILSHRTTSLVHFFHDQFYVNRNESRPELLAVKRPPRFCSEKGRGRKSLRSAWKAETKEPNNWPIEPAQKGRVVNSMPILASDSAVSSSLDERLDNCLRQSFSTCPSTGSGGASTTGHSRSDLRIRETTRPLCLGKLCRLTLLVYPMARPATSEVLEKLASHCYQTLCSNYPTLPDFPKKPVIFHKSSKVSRIVRFLQSLVARCPIYPTRGGPAPAGLVLSQHPVWLCEKNQPIRKLF